MPFIRTHFDAILSSLLSNATVRPDKRFLSKHGFLERLESELASLRQPAGLGVLVMSLARSDDIDAMLDLSVARDFDVQIMARIRASLREQDCITMASHNEVWILLPRLPSTAIASLAANRLVHELEAPFIHQDTVTTVRPCIGVALSNGPLDRGQDALAMLKAASLAKRRARVLGVPYFVATEEENSHQLNMDMIVALRRALAENALSLAYQPKVDLQSGRAVGVEALIRWPDGAEPFMTPTMLVGIAEQFGMMRQLTRFVIHTALREHASELAAVGVDKVWINLSARMLNDPGLLDFLMQSLAVWNTPPQALGLELTESMLITDGEQTIAVLNRLASMGFCLAIDDFGTGYSSMAYLRRLPIHKLKIDNTFVKNITSSLVDRQIVQTIIDLAHNFELQVVAEGVEDSATLALLADMGCDLVQGFIYAKGMPVQEAAAWWTSFNDRKKEKLQA